MIKKFFSWLDPLLVNTKVSFSLEGWPAATTAIGLGGFGVLALKLLIDAGLLHSSKEE